MQFLLVVIDAWNLCGHLVNQNRACQEPQVKSDLYYNKMATQKMLNSRTALHQKHAKTEERK